MTHTERAIHSVATALCHIEDPKNHHATYVRALESFAALVRSEVLVELQRDFNTCMHPRHVK